MRSMRLVRANAARVTPLNPRHAHPAHPAHRDSDIFSDMQSSRSPERHQEGGQETVMTVTTVMGRKVGAAFANDGLESVRLPVQGQSTE